MTQTGMTQTQGWIIIVMLAFVTGFTCQEYIWQIWAEWKSWMVRRQQDRDLWDACPKCYVRGRGELCAHHRCPHGGKAA